MTIKIIVADDHPITRKGLCSVLSAEPDMEIIAETGDGQNTIDKAITMKPDIVIMDISMPEVDGIEATRKILSSCPDVIVLGLSIYTNRHYVLEMLKAGAKGYLPKDCDEEEVIKAIHYVLTGKIYLSTEIASEIATDYVEISSGRNREPGELSPREMQILKFIAEGKTSKEMASSLHISQKTVEAHRSRIMDKLKLYSIAELARYAERAKLILY